MPTTADVAYAADKRPDLRDHLLTITEKFIANARAQGQRYTDASAAWRLWVLRERKAASHDQPAVEHRSFRSPERHSAGLADRNRDAASACLERVLARRGQPLAA
jgi:hypothetical protein